MKRKRSSVIGWLAAGALSISLVAGCGARDGTGRAAGENAVAKLGEIFPSYRAASLDGSSFDLNQRRGEVILLNLWATWCGPCRAEIPELEALHRQNAGRRFAVIGVSIDSEDQKGAVRDFVKKQQITYPIVLDPDATLQSLLQTSAIPTSALIDREGRVVWMKVGAIRANDAGLEEALKKTL